MSKGLVAISIEDSECDTEKQDHTTLAVADDEAKKDDEPLLPNKMGYEWKEITQEFFEAVKGSKNRSKMEHKIQSECN